MAELRLPRLPDRTSVKLTINLAPDLRQALDDYAEVYRLTYGESEPVVDLVPAMLAQFLAADRGFAKAREALKTGGNGR